MDNFQYLNAICEGYVHFPADSKRGEVLRHHDIHFYPISSFIQTLYVIGGHDGIKTLSSVETLDLSQLLHDGYARYASRHYIMAICSPY